MHILHGLGKTEHVAREMKCYRLSILAVTETHLSEEGEMMFLAEENGYTMIFSGRQDEHYMERVGLALTPHAGATMQYHQAVSSRVLAAEFLTKVGPLHMLLPTRTAQKRKTSSTLILTTPFLCAHRDPIRIIVKPKWRMVFK